MTDHPSGGRYETQEERFGSGGLPRNKPAVVVEQSFTFNEEQIKQVLLDYVQKNYGVTGTSVVSDYKEPKFHNQLDNSPGYCKFTVKARR